MKDAPKALDDAVRSRAVILPSHIRRIVLAGYMGAGKSTVGRAIAAAVGWAFADVDDLVCEATGITVPEIFEVQGEAAFRRYESYALARSLGRAQVVIALGGGAPEVITNRLLIEQTPGTCALLLTASFPILFDRCTLQALASGVALRPNLIDPVAARARYSQRMPFYCRLAHLTVETDELSPQQTLDTALSALERHTPSG